MMIICLVFVMFNGGSCSKPCFLFNSSYTDSFERNMAMFSSKPKEDCKFLHTDNTSNCFLYILGCVPYGFLPSNTLAVSIL